MNKYYFMGVLLIFMLIVIVYASMGSNTVMHENFDTSDGVVSTIAGTGERGGADGPGKSSTFYYPSQLICDSKGNIYIADTDSNKIRKIDSNGNVSTVAGSGSFGLGDGPASKATFFNPRGIAIDNTTGELFVLDSGSGNIRKIDSSGNVTTLNLSSKFMSAVGIAIDSAGNLYVPVNDKVYKIDKSEQITTVGQSGVLSSLSGITIDSTGNIYLTGGNKIYKINPSGTTSLFVENNSFNSLFGIAIDSVGNLYVANRASNKINKVDANKNVSTVAGTGSWGAGDGPALEASFNSPFGVAIDSAGNLYVSDNVNHKIRKITGVTGKPPGPSMEVIAPPPSPPPQAPVVEAPPPVQKDLAPVVDKQAVNDALAPPPLEEGKEKEYDENQLMSMYAMLHPRNGNNYYLDVIKSFMPFSSD